MTQKHTFADEIGMQVEYLGENVNRQFCFGNGSPLVTDIYPTLSEAVARWGKRLKTNDQQFQFSGPFIAGRADAKHSRPYAPIRQGGKQAVLEYGTGYIRGLVDLMAGQVPPRIPVSTADKKAERRVQSEASVPSISAASKPDPIKGDNSIGSPTPVVPAKRKAGRPRKIKIGQ